MKFRTFKTGDLVCMVSMGGTPIREKTGVILGPCFSRASSGHYKVLWFDKNEESITLWFMIKKLDKVLKHVKL